MKTTIIIPAFNEEKYIAETLNSLPGDLVDPIVAVNGSSDKTAEIAESLGAKVMDFEQQGKLPAVQNVLRHLGNRALKPLVILDADTHPVMPRRWHNAMIKLLTTEEATPAVIGGPVWFSETDMTSNSIRWLLRLRASIKTTRDSRIWQAGPNMGLYIQNKATLERILELPHYWPGEDQAIIREILRSPGTYKQPFNPALHTVTRIHAGMPSIRERLQIGRPAYNDRVTENYLSRAAPGSIPAKI